MTDTTTTNVTAQEQEMKEAQASGTVSFEDKKAEKENSLNYTHTFKTPREIEGKKYTSLTFYFEKLTGEDIEAVEAELQDQNKYVLSPEISSAFQCILAAKAAGVASDEIRRLPVPDYMKIKNAARDFLIATGY
ncbi:MAG: phage tail assembly protein [Phascolarctobacterium sp.]|nr:phage tail assembly protein [Candidatus Phascolarctobacterium caballi]